MQDQHSFDECPEIRGRLRLLQNGDQRAFDFQGAWTECLGAFSLWVKEETTGLLSDAISRRATRRTTLCAWESARCMSGYNMLYRTGLQFDNADRLNACFCDSDISRRKYVRWVHRGRHVPRHYSDGWWIRWDTRMQLPALDIRQSLLSISNLFISSTVQGRLLAMAYAVPSHPNLVSSKRYSCCPIPLYVAR